MWRPSWIWYHWVVKKLLWNKTASEKFLKNKQSGSPYFLLEQFWNSNINAFCMNWCDYFFPPTTEFHSFIVIYYLYVHVHLTQIILCTVWSANSFLQTLTSGQCQRTFLSYIWLHYSTIKCQCSHKSLCLSLKHVETQFTNLESNKVRCMHNFAQVKTLHYW